MHTEPHPHRPTAKRLHILQASLRWKEEAFNDRLQQHFDTVKLANGQPLNDKRNGNATMQRWERQHDALCTANQGIEKTKAAIEREKSKINHVGNIRQELPQPIIALIDNGTLNQWRKHPNRFFVDGVEKGRIIWDLKKKTLLVSHHNSIPNQEQYAKFRDVFRGLKTAIGLTQQCN